MKKSAIIFGASVAGRRTWDYYGGAYRIVGFADNDTRKHGSFLMGLPIHTPERLSTLDFDVVLIGSTYVGDITRQLQELGIAPERIGWISADILQGRFEGVRFVRSGVWVALAATGAIMLYGCGLLLNFW